MTGTATSLLAFQSEGGASWVPALPDRCHPRMMRAYVPSGYPFGRRVRPATHDCELGALRGARPVVSVDERIRSGHQAQVPQRTGEEA
jgi:hypothetical protein